MRTPLQISLAMNVVLAVGLIFIWLERPKTPAQTTPPVPPAARMLVAGEGAPAKPAAPRGEPAQFRWDQLYSKNYHDYVKNLRAIGCPEPTVRAIVTADVDSVYQIFEHQLEVKLSTLQNGSWSQQLTASGSEQALQDSLQHIPDEETAKIADLLGLKPAPATVASVTPAAPLTAPLVLQNLDLSALNLSADQTQAIAGIRQDFLQETGGANPGSLAPASQAGWHKAQAEADNKLEALLGYNVYARYQTAAYQGMLQNVAPQSP